MAATKSKSPNDELFTVILSITARDANDTEDGRLQWLRAKLDVAKEMILERLKKEYPNGVSEIQVP